MKELIEILKQDWIIVLSISLVLLLMFGFALLLLKINSEEDTVKIKPWITIIAGLILSAVLWLVAQVVLSNSVYYLINDTDFYQNLPTGYRKLIIYGPSNLISAVMATFFFIFGLGEEHLIPELEECKRRSAKITKRQIKGRALDAPPLINWPTTAKADFVPSEGFEGFYLFLGTPMQILGLNLDSGFHWKIPGLMKIAIVQTALVSSEFATSGPSKIRNTVSAHTPGVIELKELAGSIRFTARGLITYSVYDAITYYKLDDSTKQLQLLSYVHAGCRNHIKKSFAESLMGETSREDLMLSLEALITGLDGDGTTIQEIGLRVSEFGGINLEDLEATDLEVRRAFESVSKTQLKEFGDQIKYENHALGIERLEKAGLKDAEKASENILAMDKDAKMNINRDQEKIEFVGDAKSDGAILSLIKKFIEGKGK